MNNSAHPTLHVTYRGEKVEMPLLPGTSVQSVKEAIIHASTTSATTASQDPSDSPSPSCLSPADVKLMLKGKVLTDDKQDLYTMLIPPSTTTRKQQSKPKVFRLMASGVSKAVAARNNEEFSQQQKKLAREVRDDLTDRGLQQQEERQRKGHQMLQKAAASSNRASNPYKFHNVQPLPNLPDEDKAREILETLANDPGILACLAKHRWQVGTLTELFPRGKVGESVICVLGLNENMGQSIKLRIRTDDMKGFRKMLTIRKVLFHELAHNVHSEHNQEFFVLMRQIEKECEELDWTHGAGLSATSTTLPSYQGGTFRLGGGGVEGSNSSETDSLEQQPRSRRELALRAALRRMTDEEEQIEQNCGCNQANLFLPPPRENGSPSCSDPKKE